MHFHCCLVHPRGRPHVAAFIEMIECVQGGLTPLGHHVTIAENVWDTEAIKVCFGAHHLARIGFPRDHLPLGVILYNLEPLRPGTIWDRPEVVARFAQFPCGVVASRMPPIESGMLGRVNGIRSPSAIPLAGPGFAAKILQTTMCCFTDR